MSVSPTFGEIVQGVPDIDWEQASAEHTVTEQYLHITPNTFTSEFLASLAVKTAAANDYRRQLYQEGHSNDRVQRAYKKYLLAQQREAKTHSLYTAVSFRLLDGTPYVRAVREAKQEQLQELETARIQGCSRREIKKRKRLTKRMSKLLLSEAHLHFTELRDDE